MRLNPKRGIPIAGQDQKEKRICLINPSHEWQFFDNGAFRLECAPKSVKEVSLAEFEQLKGLFSLTALMSKLRIEYVVEAEPDSPQARLGSVKVDEIEEERLLKQELAKFKAANPDATPEEVEEFCRVFPDELKKQLSGATAKPKTDTNVSDWISNNTK